MGRRAAWRPVTVAGRPPKECVDCVELPVGERPKTWRPTNHAPLTPRCVTHQRAERKRSRAVAAATYQKTVYGLSKAQHSDLLEFQGGRCAVCRYATGKSKALATDHDHKCCAGPTSCGGCVRGKCCGPDNELLGRIELIAGRNSETVFDVLARIARYFDCPPMAQIRRGGAPTLPETQKVAQISHQEAGMAVSARGGQLR